LVGKTQNLDISNDQMIEKFLLKKNLKKKRLAPMNRKQS